MSLFSKVKQFLSGKKRKRNTGNNNDDVVNVLSHILNAPESYNFQKELEPGSKMEMDYSIINPNYITLVTIKSKYTDNGYKTFDDFDSDMNRLFAQEQRFYNFKSMNKVVQKRKENMEKIKKLYNKIISKHKYGYLRPIYYDDKPPNKNKRVKISCNIRDTNISNNQKRNSDNPKLIIKNKDLIKRKKSQKKVEVKDDEKRESKIEMKDHKHVKSKKKCSLLFVGETGTGKSTLLASFADFINGVKFKDVKCTEKIQDKAKQGQSQTQISSQFQLSNDEWAVNIMDTPGIGDTKGFGIDQKHLDNIIKNVGEFGDFNAVCILIKRGTTRATTRLKYIIGELKAHMPKDVQNNFIVVMTRSDVPIPDRDTLKVIETLKLPIDNIIPINNCSYEELDLSRYGKNSPMRKMVKQRQKDDYYRNHNSLQLLLEHAYKMKPYQGSKILSLKIERDKLKEEVGLLKMKIDDSFEIQRKIQENLVALQSAKNIEELNKAYNQSKKAPKFTYFKENGKITTHCNACSKACHIGCGLNYGDDLNFCSCSKSGKCKKCGCSMSSHTHLGWKKKTEYETIECINEQMKLEWKNAKDRQRMIQKQQNLMLNRLQWLESERDHYVKSIQKKYHALKNIAIIGYNESFGCYINECIKATERDHGLSKKQKKQKIKIFKDALKEYKLLVDVVRNQIKVSKYIE